VFTDDPVSIPNSSPSALTKDRKSAGKQSWSDLAHVIIVPIVMGYAPTPRPKHRC
jgi:hypothetical protein